MTGETQTMGKESFWREHQDTLVKIREDLSSGKKSRSRVSPGGAIRKRTPVVPAAAADHPPFGKYRRTPSPYLPKLDPQQDRHSPYDNNYARPQKYDLVPPVKPKVAFSKSRADDYDSWGEESEEEEEGRRAMVRPRKSQPQAYPNYMQPQVMYGAPFPVYYPPPPQGARRKKKVTGKASRAGSYSAKYQQRKALASQSSHLPLAQGKKRQPMHQSMPMFAPMMQPMMMYPPVEEEEEEDSEEDEMLQKAYRHFVKHPLFAADVTNWFINECLDTELLPDFLIEMLNDMKHMPYNHPLYVPTLYVSEDVLGDQISELMADVAREAVVEAASDIQDERQLKRDPLEDFLTDLLAESVRQGAREVVREAVLGMAQDHLETEVADGIIHSLLDDYLDVIAPDMLEDVIFEIVAEEFIESEVIAPEVREESRVIAMETIQHYDTKVMRREFKEVSTQAKHKLADSVMMEYLVSLMSQQGKLFTEADHLNRYLDDMLLNLGMGQMFGVQKQRDKTQESKPLHKLHQKVVSDVALDVFLQHLTRSLDEDLADVDEYERGLNDGVLQPIPLIIR